jgi:hypothetical protein
MASDELEYANSAGRASSPAQSRSLSAIAPQANELQESSAISRNFVNGSLEIQKYYHFEECVPPESFY